MTTLKRGATGEVRMLINGSYHKVSIFAVGATKDDWLN
jgi:hypothetical protein